MGKRAKDKITDQSIGTPSEKEIIGPYAEGAQFVRRILGRASHRGTAIRTDVNPTTIGTMRRGRRANIGNTIKFARAYRLNPNLLLRLFGHEPIPEFDLIDWSARQPQLVREGSTVATRYETAKAMHPPGAITFLLSVRPADTVDVLTQDGTPVRLTAEDIDRLLHIATPQK